MAVSIYDINHNVHTQYLFCRHSYDQSTVTPRPWPCVQPRPWPLHQSYLSQQVLTFCLTTMLPVCAADLVCVCFDVSIARCICRTRLVTFSAFVNSAILMNI